MKNVTLVTDFGYAGRATGGATHCGKEFFRIFDALPVNLTVFALRYKGETGQPPIRSPKVHYIDLPFRSFVSLAEAGIPWALKIRSRLKKMPPQDLYISDQPLTCFSWFPKAPVACLFIGPEAGWHFGLGHFLRHPRSSLEVLLWQKPFLGRMQRGLLRRETGIPLINSRYTLLLLAAERNIDPRELEPYVIYQPMDVAGYRRDEEARAARRQGMGLGADDVLIAYISNFAPKKRADRVPAIVRYYYEALPETTTKFVFIGRGIAASALDELAASDAFRGRCLRIGEVKPHEVREFYSASDIAITTSESETFGYTVTEGMAAGLPTVAYGEGSLPEIVTADTGILLPKDDAKGFANALARLTADTRLRRKMGLAAAERAQKEFSREAFGARLLKILGREFGIP
jgi:glycosyltransferase involved in cell wall biosynthesis